MLPIIYKNRFIYSVQGDPRWAADKLREHLARGLELKGARNVVVDGEYIRFAVTWYFFRGISNGEIMVAYRDHRLEVAYQIGLIKYLGIAIITVGLVMIMPFIWPPQPLLTVLGVLSVFFCWIGLSIAVGIAMTITLFNQFMKDRLREFFNSVSSLGVQGELITSR